MIETVFHILGRCSYFVIFLFVAQCIRLLWKRPFPSNAPKFVAGYPLVGALQFVNDREGFCHRSKMASPTGNYSFYLGRDRVVGLSGPQGRRTFFESRDLDLDAGSALFLPWASLALQADIFASDAHPSNLRSVVRTTLLRTQTLESIPATIEAYTTATLDHIAMKGLFDPFRELTWSFTQSAMAAMGIGELASSSELSRRVSDMLGALEGTFTAIDIVVPWPLNPWIVSTLVVLARLSTFMSKVICNRKQQQQPHKDHPGKHGMLHDLIDRGWSTGAILQVVLGAAFGAQGNTPTVTSWTLIGLSTDGHWMAQVRKEVSQVIFRYQDNGESADQVLRSLSMHTWEHEFPLLHACLLESIRLAVLPVVFRKNISTTDVKIGDTGEVIPPGAYATYDFRDGARNPEIYPGPQRWDPGRFLPDRAERLKEAIAFTGFGAGRRKCRK
ncbi:cytochrome P450 [Aspergillus tubingensis]|uniref:cytochrome P450 n=1 Tax=Aspergillus tubingensis TaxID=5068 RepID=UPI001578947E|nr:cytochrome P450 [Aspergillus tubingensis]GFN21569.1 cytochrome P450 [Aspergillus tubingensis]